MQREGARPTEKFSQETSQVQREGEREGGTGVLGTIGETLGVISGAVGETLVEIAENTKNIVVGQGQSGMGESGEQEWGSSDQQSRQEGRSSEQQGQQGET